MAINPRLTIREFAKLAGVSRSTASLALRNHPNTAEKTRLHVLKAAKKYGYIPDPLTSTLMGQLRTARKKRGVEKIAYLTSWNQRDEWRKSTYALALFEGAKARAEALGYELEPIWAKEPGMTAARLSKILYTRAIRGVIISPLLRARGHLSLDWKHFAAATIAHTVVKPDLHRASHFHYNGMLLAIRSLKHRGYRRIGFVNLIEQIERVNHSWLAGYLVYEREFPSKHRISPLLLKTWDKKGFSVWMEKYCPDAIISNHIEPLNYLKELKYRVPQDIGYANLDTASHSENLAGIDQQQPKVAAAAVDLVVAQLQQNEFGLPEDPKIVNLQGVWKEGPTTRRFRK